MVKINLIIYEGAMCCSTGVCGPEPNKELIEFNETLKKLRNEFKDVDVVVLSVPYQGIVPLLKDLIPYFSDQIVISLVVPMKKNRWFEYTPPKQGSAALEIQDILPKSVKVVSAYHNVPARKLANIEIALDYDVVVCGDNDDAKRIVMELTREINELCHCCVACKKRF